ncbi:MAG: tRNA-binding protein [Sphaerochaetaceae bacterium]
MAVYEDFAKLDIRVGEIVKVKPFLEARNPSYKIWVDFGPQVGIKQSSAQITQLYKPADLIGKQVLAVVNFPVRQIASFLSEVLILGTYSQQGVVLIVPDKPVENGDKLG